MAELRNRAPSQADTTGTPARPAETSRRPADTPRRPAETTQGLAETPRRPAETARRPAPDAQRSGAERMRALYGTPAYPTPHADASTPRPPGRMPNRTQRRDPDTPRRQPTTVRTPGARRPRQPAATPTGAIDYPAASDTTTRQATSTANPAPSYHEKGTPPTD